MNQSQPAPHSPRSEYLPWIDGLRAIAVLAVMLYHLRNEWLPGGFAGVDVFFVISGFVVSASVARWDRGGLGSFLMYFYARRIQRIAPALIACLLVTTVVSCLFIPNAWLSSTVDRTGLFAFIGMSNLFLAFQNENYFAPSAEFNPYVHTWSLGVEEQFYLLFPLLFFAWTRSGRGRVVSLVLFGLALVASLVDAWWRSTSNPAAAFYLITTRFWELAAGVLMFQLLHRGGSESGRPSRFAFPAALLACVALVVLGWSLWTSNAQAFPYPQAILPIAASLGILAGLSLANPTTLLARLLGSTPMLYIGRRSYSLYLWHWPVLVLMRWTSGVEGAAMIVLALVATFLLAHLSYRFVETPLRYSSRLRTWSRPRVVLAGLVVIFLTTTAAYGLIMNKSVLAQSTVMRNAAEWYPSPIPTLPELPGCHLLARDEGVGAHRTWTYTREGCPEQTQLAPNLFAVGDSHTLAFNTMLSEYVLRSGARVVIYPNIGCSFASLRPGFNVGACPAQGEAIVADISARAQTGDLLFLAALRLARLTNQDAVIEIEDHWQTMTDPVHAAAQQQDAEHTRYLLRPLADRGIRIIFEAPLPLFRTSAFRCSDAFNSGNPVCRAGNSESRAALASYRDPVVRALQQLAGQLDASIWDPFPVLCPGERCQNSRDGHPLYFDGDHISAYANRLLFPSFHAFVKLLTSEPGKQDTSATHGS